MASPRPPGDVPRENGGTCAGLLLSAGTSLQLSSSAESIGNCCVHGDAHPVEVSALSLGLCRDLPSQASQ